MATKGRPKTFNNIDALEKAKDLFWARGFESTSLSELIETMGISRQSMYNTFGNKHDLFIQCLEYYIYQNHESLNELLNSSSHAKDKLETFINNMKEMFNDENSKGCFVSVAIQEMANKDVKVKEILDNKYSKNYELFKSFFAEAMRKNEIKSELSSIELANLFDSILLSISSLCKLSNRSEQVNSVFSTFKKQIQFT